MIPVIMGQQDMNRGLLFNQLITKEPDTGTGIEGNIGAVTQLDMYARSVPPITHILCARCWNGTSYTIEG